MLTARFSLFTALSPFRNVIVLQVPSLFVKIQKIMAHSVIRLRELLGRKGLHGTASLLSSER